MLRSALGSFEDLRRLGAAALDLAWTAAGTFDGFFELGLGTWDVAAGAALVAGGGRDRQRLGRAARAGRSAATSWPARRAFKEKPTGACSVSWARPE